MYLCVFLGNNITARIAGARGPTGEKIFWLRLAFSSENQDRVPFCIWGGHFDLTWLKSCITPHSSNGHRSTIRYQQYVLSTMIKPFELSPSLPHESSRFYLHRPGQLDTYAPAVWTGVSASSHWGVCVGISPFINCWIRIFSIGYKLIVIETVNLLLFLYNYFRYYDFNDICFILYFYVPS